MASLDLNTFFLIQTESYSFPISSSCWNTREAQVIIVNEIQKHYCMFYVLASSGYIAHCNTLFMYYVCMLLLFSQVPKFLYKFLLQSRKTLCSKHDTSKDEHQNVQPHLEHTECNSDKYSSPMLLTTMCAHIGTRFNVRTRITGNSNASSVNQIVFTGIASCPLPSS